MITHPAPLRDIVRAHCAWRRSVRCFLGAPRLRRVLHRCPWRARRCARGVPGPDNRSAQGSRLDVRGRLPPGFGIALPLLFLTGNHANANGQVGGHKLTAAEKRGRELFGEHCAVCHTLAAANAIGKVGPNLDTLKPSATLVLHTIENGCLPNPPSTNPAENCLGEGVMPAGIIQGQDAQDVAKFVAQVAGRE